MTKWNLASWNFTSIEAQPRSNDSGAGAPGSETVGLRLEAGVHGLDQLNRTVGGRDRTTKVGSDERDGPMLALSESAATSYSRPRAISSTCRKSRLGGVGPGWVGKATQFDTSCSPIRSGRSVAISSAIAAARAGKSVNSIVP